MRTIHLLSLLVISHTHLCAQSIRKPLAAAYTGLGAYSVHHVDVFSFSSNQAALAQIKDPAIGVYGERRFLLDAMNMYSAVAALPTKQGNFGIAIDYFGFKNYNESQIGIAYARSLGAGLTSG